MQKYQIYKDIQIRTGGDIYIGIVGPVRTGKSTFVRRFMELVALPEMQMEEQAEVRDQLPLSGSGKIITTVEPKFIPKEAVSLNLEGEYKVKVKLIDCVGFLVQDAAGHIEEGKERMVKTPWSDQEIPFHEAARIGTEKVIREHSTIGLMITSDGSFGELPRKNFLEAEQMAILELKKQEKPFLVIVNSQVPYKEETKELVEHLRKKYHVTALAINCEQLKKEDVFHILESILYEFPVSEIQYFIPKWVELLPKDHAIKKELLKQIRNSMKPFMKIKSLSQEKLCIDLPYIQEVLLEKIELSSGRAVVRVRMKEAYYYQMLSQMTGITIGNEYELIETIKNLASMKKEYMKVREALESVKGTGYGVVVPELSEIQMEEPDVIKQGNKYGVKIRSKSPSVHMIRANIETEIAPIVGTEQQAKDLIQYIGDSALRGESIWETSIFGKSMEQLVQDGIRGKLSAISEESQQKLQDTMQKIVNDSRGGLVCIII